MTDNNNLTLFQLTPKSVLVSGESCFFSELDPKTLKLTTKHDTNKSLSLNFACPHPLHDSKTSTSYTIGSTIPTGLKFHFVSMDTQNGPVQGALQSSKIVASISPQSSTLLSVHHSFAMTESYLLFVEQPFVLNVGKLLRGVFQKDNNQKGLSGYLEWHSELRNRFHVIHKEDPGRKLEFDIESEIPFMFMHIVNSYEEVREGLTVIVLDLILFENADFFDANFIERILDENKCSISPTEYGQVARFVIPVQMDGFKEIGIGSDIIPGFAVKSGKNKVLLSQKFFSPKGVELPSVSPKVRGKPYRYASIFRIFINCAQTQILTKNLPIFR